VLKKAKHENRVVSLGKYKDGVTSKYVFCVFPTKLAAIIQMQGRRDQLQIPFGIPKAPDCRGITPEELERINFENLKLDEIVAEWTGRKNIPDSSAIETSLTNHVEQLEAKGVAHE
jgi:conjugal transfer mating pair stabilization protein TraN